MQLSELFTSRMLTYIDGSRAVVVWILAKVVNVTTIMFLMSGDLTGLCLYILWSSNAFN